VLYASLKKQTHHKRTNDGLLRRASSTSNFEKVNLSIPNNLLSINERHNPINIKKTKDGSEVKEKVIYVEDKIININEYLGADYICLTDIVKGEEGNDHIKNWMRNRNTVEFLGLWETLNNPGFKGVEFDTFRKQAGLNSFTLTPRKWIESTKAIGITSKAGNKGGTYAHKDIALEFCTWLSPLFKLLVLKEFQRLKQAETLQGQWDLRRYISKVNYKIQTEAIAEKLVPLSNLPKEKEGIIYAEEAELLNFVLFGVTAKE